MQQMQEMAAYLIVIGLHLDAAAVSSIVIPVKEHGTKRCNQLVGNFAGSGIKDTTDRGLLDLLTDL